MIENDIIIFIAQNNRFYSLRLQRSMIKYGILAVEEIKQLTWKYSAHHTTHIIGFGSIDPWRLLGHI